MSQKSQTGKLGEDLACEYLKSKGYRIIDRNYRAKIGEIDIIGIAPDRTLIFFEIKTMKESGNSATRLQFGQVAELTPEDNLTRSKILKLSRVCRLFAAKNQELVNDKKGWRIDLLAISLDSNSEPEFRHYENIS